VAIVLALAFFGGSIGAGAPHYALTLVAPRAPGFASPPLPLATAAGRAVLFQDLVPVIGALAAVVGLALRTRERVTVGLAVFYVSVFVASFVALTCLDFEGQASESHRFATALFVAAPIVTALALERRARAAPAGLAFGGLAALTAYVTLGLGVASTVEWLASGVAYRQCTQKGFGGYRADAFTEVDCRRDTGAALNERPAHTYVDGQGFFLWSGCHPTFAAAPPSTRHKIKVNGPWTGRPAVEQLVQDLTQDIDKTAEALTVACLADPAAGPNRDPACLRAPAIGSCAPRGAEFRVCALEGAQRAILAPGM
jgi:hypothetical protein